MYLLRRFRGSGFLARSIINSGYLTPLNFVVNIFIAVYIDIEIFFSIGKARICGIAYKPRRKGASLYLRLSASVNDKLVLRLQIPKNSRKLSKNISTCVLLHTRKKIPKIPICFRYLECVFSLKEFFSQNVNRTIGN